MFETQNFGDVLGKVEPRSHPQRKKRALIEANREAIYAARDRGCTWAEIAEALSKAGFVVSPNALRLAMNEKPRDLKKYPRTMMAERKPRQKSKQSSIEGRGEIQGGTADKECHENRIETQSETSAHVPVSMDPNKFAGIRRQNART